jgi:hypothetical protein
MKKQEPTEGAPRREVNMVTNTSETMRSPGNKDAFLREAMMRAASGGSASDAILAQEALGQQELVHSDVLPVEGSTRPQMKPAWRSPSNGSPAPASSRTT